MATKKMTDEQIRETLGRIESPDAIMHDLQSLWDFVSSPDAVLRAKNGSTASFHVSIADSLRTLAECWAALEEIGNAPRIWEGSDDPYKTGYDDGMVDMQKIAHDATKGRK